MSITSVPMRMHQHQLSAISFVICAYAIGMYAFSLVSGKMADHWGRIPVIALGSLVLIASCIIAVPSISFIPLVIALFLLGLGWNFAYVAGSALLADQLTARERAKTQGLNDLLLNLASAGSQAAAHNLRKRWFWSSKHGSDSYGRGTTCSCIVIALGRKI